MMKILLPSNKKFSELISGENWLSTVFYIEWFFCFKSLSRAIALYKSCKAIKSCKENNEIYTKQT